MERPCFSIKISICNVIILSCIVISGGEKRDLHRNFAVVQTENLEGGSY